MTERSSDEVGRDDLDECWCCAGLHDGVGSLCPSCDDAGCQHFGDECDSDHKPVLPNGGQSQGPEPKMAHAWVCDGCGKHITSQPFGDCTDCGGPFLPATDDRLACDRCGDPDASSVFNSEHNRLCEDCIDYENRDNPQCPNCGRRMLPDGSDDWECPDCWEVA